MMMVQFDVALLFTLVSTFNQSKDGLDKEWHLFDPAFKIIIMVV
jgi:hypothetical protein